MIAACPKCQTRYRVEPERLGSEGARLRCSQCSAVFRVRLPAPPTANPNAPIEAPAPNSIGGTAPASDTAVLGGVARSEPKASEAHEARVPHGNQALSAEGRSVTVTTAAAEGRSGARISEPIEARPVTRTPDLPGDATPHFDHARLVLVAHPNPDACKRIAEALEAEGLQVLVAHDGVEAILSIQRALPRAVVLDAALPKMFGFQVCELVKRNESLRVTQVCLMGAIHREDRYRRAPNEIYGADFYIESPSVPTGLLEWLGRIGFALRSNRQPAPPSPIEAPSSDVTTGGKPHASDTAVLGGVARSEPEASGAHKARVPNGNQALSAEGRSATRITEPAEGRSVTQATALAEGRSVTPQHRAAPEAPAPTPQRVTPEAAATKMAIGRIGAPADPLSAERAQAERLARIIVSDIVLYNEEKFSAAVRSGGVLEAMRDELAEGRTLFRERIDVKVRDERDFLADELMRVARGRGTS